MTDFRTKFTKWYYRKGYRMVYVPCSYGTIVPEMIFICPWWVRPLVYFLFSPCAYYQESGYELDNYIDNRLRRYTKT